MNKQGEQAATTEWGGDPPRGRKESVIGSEVSRVG
jgi:hypothetical protein